MPVSAPSARERLLEVASRLFYAEGIHAVGIDRVIAEADVAKATLYAHFSSKDELVAAYLARQSQGWGEAVERQVGEAGPGSLAAALAPFDLLAERAGSFGYRGCPFINAAAEFPERGPVADQVAAHRRLVRAKLSELMGPAGQDRALLDAIVSLYDGAMSDAYLDRDPTVVPHARLAAEELLAYHGVR